MGTRVLFGAGVRLAVAVLSVLSGLPFPLSGQGSARSHEPVRAQQAARRQEAARPREPARRQELPRAQEAQDRAPGELRGRVASRAGEPVEGANVFLLETLEGALSGPDGRFAFRTARRGEATLVALRPGYRAVRVPVVLPADTPLVLVLDPAPIPLPPLEVAAGRVLVADAPDAVLSPLEVVTTPGSAADVFRALQTFPGVQAVDEGAGLFVRGGEASETRVFLDGAVVLAPYRYESPAGGSFGAFDPFALDGIAFSTGGFGARYGDALSAVADLRTRGRPERTGGGASVSLAALSGTLALALPRGLGVRATATRADTRLLFDLNGRAGDFTRDPEGRDLSGSAVWAYRPAGELKVFSLDQWSRLGVVVAEPSYTGAFESDERHGLHVLSWRDVFGRIAPAATVALARAEDARALGALHLATEERLFQVHARVGVSPGARWTFVLGGDVERRRSSFRGSVPARGHDLAPDARRVLVGSTVRGAREALFAEADWRAAERLRLVAGLRTDRASLPGRRTWDPRAAAAFRLGGGLALTAAWGLYHQVASPFDYEPATGDPSLPPMRAEHRVLGAVAEARGLLVRLEAYDKRSRDLAQRARDGAVRRGGRGAARGVDVFFRWNGRPGSDLRVAYSFLDARRTDPNTGQDARSPYDITHTFHMVAERTFGSRWQVGAAYRSATGRPFTPVVGAAPDPERPGGWVPEYGPPMSERLPAFRRLDLSGSVLHRFWPGNLTVFFLGVTNALDRVNVYAYRYSADYRTRVPERSPFRRAVYFGVTLTF